MEAEHRPIIAVLAVQGAFIEHEKKLESLGATCIELRCAADLARPFDALVLPGGESTVQGKLLRESGMLEPLRALVKAGMPVLATCAGMILLAACIEGGDGPYLGTIPMTVRRNAYGRQLDSFRTTGRVENVGKVPFTFIRAPFVVEVGGGCSAIARVDGNIVGVRCGNQTALAFHPELDESNTIHEAFLETVRNRKI